MNNQRIFYFILGNNLIASVANALVWFALTFWLFLQTESVLVMSYSAGIYAVLNMALAIPFGSIVDRLRKKTAMIYSSIGSLLLYGTGTIIFLTHPAETWTNPGSVILWVLIIVLMLGGVIGNLRQIALSTTVSLLFTTGKDKANGLVGITNGISFAATSILSGVMVGFLGMQTVLITATVATTLVLAHLIFVPLPETISNDIKEKKSRTDIRGTIKIIRSIPGLAALILFTTFNNFLGGAFMALMDAYGLSLVSVQTWGIVLAITSLGFIIGSSLVAKFGLGRKPIRTMLLVNGVVWIVSMLFPLQPLIALVGIGFFIYMVTFPIIEAAEQTVIQSVVPLPRQGRVFGLAQSIEQAATPLTAFLAGPLAALVFIPLMSDGGAGAELIGSWYGTGADRGIGLVFITAGAIGLVATLLAFASPSYRRLTETLKKAVI